MVSAKKIRESLMDILSNAGKQGFHQSLLEKVTGYSKSYLSEILSSMEADGIIVREPEIGRNNRIWISTDYPGEVEGLLKVGMLKSTEYFYHIAALRKISEYGNLKLSITAYDRASDIVTGVVEGVLDLGFAPAISVILSSDASKLSIISSVASGGAFIFENTTSKSKKLASSELSSMSLLSASMINENKELVMEYYRDPSDAMNRFLSGKVRYLVIWEPFASLIHESATVKKIRSFGEVLDDSPCCLLICNQIQQTNRKELLSKLKLEIRESVHKPEDAAARYSLSELCRLLKLPQDIILRSLNSYRFKHECTTDELKKVVQNTGISVSESLIEQMIG